jgi:Ran GTPase-activating protein (RanGAP) involved in mRNA processing and transport
MLLGQNIHKAKSLEQLLLRDNNVGVEAGDVFLDAIKSKNNLWRLQLDMNMVKYATLVEIDKICKKNKRTVHDRYLPHIR